MMRFLVGFVLLAVAALLLGYAGGIDVMSKSDWQGITTKWAVPSKEENDRCLALLLGGLFVLLSLVRLLRPRPRVLMPAKI